MIIEYIRYDLIAHQPEELVTAYTAAVDSLRAAPECLGFELTQCEEAPRSFILRIEWQSTAAHLQGFRKGPNFPPFLAAIKPFIAEIAEMRHYAKTPLAWTR
ncbi:MAG: antibiotic biosynthesis monooxygenase [Steroidobacteraceae bacterium]|nr:antibiotic biosynthesis monooxygenase [Steroidobacteraceae bacterium]